MQTVDKEKEALLTRISKTVEALMQRDSLYREYALDKDEIIRVMFKMFYENFSIEELKARPDIYFTEIVEAHMMTELLLAGEEDSSEEFDLKYPVLERISKIVEQLIQTNPLYQQELNKEKIMETLSGLLDKVSPEKLILLDEEQLAKRVKAVMSTELMSNLIDELKPEEVEKFNAVVEGSR